jgi:hypothetical protein
MGSMYSQFKKGKSSGELVIHIQCRCTGVLPMPFVPVRFWERTKGRTATRGRIENFIFKVPLLEMVRNCKAQMLVDRI